MIINSILDTDLYKFTTSYAYLKLFPYAPALLYLKTGTRLSIRTISLMLCKRK